MLIVGDELKNRWLAVVMVGEGRSGAVFRKQPSPIPKGKKKKRLSSVGRRDA